MKQTSRFIFILAILQMLAYNIQAQIIMNGRSPSRYHSSYSQGNALSISLGFNIWADGAATPLAGYSASLAEWHSFGSLLSLEEANFTSGINVGYERQISERLGARAAFYTAGMTNGSSTRPDLLVTTDKSRFTQIGLYARYSLTKNMDHRIQFQWLIGPELIYTKKDMIIDEYVLDEDSGPQTYRQNLSVTEGAIVTGPGASCRIAGGLSLFSDSMFGISFPGKGFKLTQTGFGLKYGW